jgi:hypothetical protein
MRPFSLTFWPLDIDWLRALLLAAKTAKVTVIAPNKNLIAFFLIGFSPLEIDRIFGIILLNLEKSCKSCLFPSFSGRRPFRSEGQARR